MNYKFKLGKNYINKKDNIKLNFNMGIGDWGLGIGDWGLGQFPIPNPKTPIPKTQIPFKIFLFYNI